MSLQKFLSFTLMLHVFTTTMADPETDCENFAFESMAFIFNDKGLCAAILVHQSWVLFGISCVENRIGFDNYTQIRNIYEPYEYRKVIETEICEPDCGFGLMKANESFSTGENFFITPLPPPNLDMSCVTSGYAYMSFKEPWEENLLSKYCGRIYIKNRTECWSDDNHYWEADYICGRYFKLGLPDSVEVCDVKTHTGGALYCNEAIYGFLNWNSCEATDDNLAFVNIAKHIDFIKQIISSGIMNGARAAKLSPSSAVNKANGISASTIYIYVTFAVIVTFVVSKFGFL